MHWLAPYSNGWYVTGGDKRLWLKMQRSRSAGDLLSISSTRQCWIWTGRGTGRTKDVARAHIGLPRSRNAAQPPVQFSVSSAACDINKTCACAAVMKRRLAGDAVAPGRRGGVFRIRRDQRDFQAYL